MTKIINSWFVGSNSRKSALTLYINESTKEQPLLIFVHGFKGFKDWGHFPLICKKIAKSGISVLAFNFSHNGGTVENPIDFPDLEAFSHNTYSKEVNDVAYILSWVMKHQKHHFTTIDLDNITILGHSRGGGIALLAAHRFSRLKRVITWAAVADFEERLPSDAALKEWEKSGIHLIQNGRTNQAMPMRYEFVKDLKNNSKALNIKRAVEELGKPLLIVHGEEDETVNFKDAERILSWSTSTQLVGIEKCSHTFNGNHPWENKDLPAATHQAVEASIRHILA